MVVVHHISADGFSPGPLTRDVMTAYASRASGSAPQWEPARGAVRRLRTVAARGSRQRGRSGVADRTAGRLLAPDAGGASRRAGSSRGSPAPRGGEQPGSVAPVRRSVPTCVVVSQSSRAGRARPCSWWCTPRWRCCSAGCRGTDDIAIGTPIAGRGDAALDDLIGMFVNTLVLRTAVDTSRSFADLLGSVRESDLEAFAHADVPFERLVEVLDPARSQARHPLFQVMLTFQNMAASTSLELPGLRVAALDFDAAIAKFDLQVTVTDLAGSGEQSQGFGVEFTYATDLFDASTVAAFAERFVRVLEAVVADPSRAGRGCRSAGRRRAGRRCSSGGTIRRIRCRSATLLDRFDAQVAASPDAVAVVFEGESLTYARVRCAGESACAVSDLAGCGSGVAGGVGDAPVGGSAGGDVCDRAGGWRVCADRSGSSGRSHRGMCSISADAGVCAVDGP